MNTRKDGRGTTAPALPAPIAALSGTGKRTATAGTCRCGTLGTFAADAPGAVPLPYGGF